MRRTNGGVFALLSWCACAADAPASLAQDKRAPFAPWEQVLVVSPAGTGTQCAAAAPCELGYAKAYARTLAAAADADVAVELSGGVYRLEASL